MSGFINKMMKLRASRNQQTIAQLLEELNEIHTFEKVEIDAPIRQDRSNEMIERTDE